MPFEQLMARVVGNRIMQDATLRRPWDAFVATGQTSILRSECNGAQDIPDTEQAALYYCLVYQKSHFDAVLAAIRAGIGDEASRPGRWLVVDFGAGPGTALLAWAAHVKAVTRAALETSYVYIEHSRSMQDICKRYIGQDDNLAPEGRWWTPSLPAGPTDTAEWVEGCQHAIFVFSYVLCQATVTSSDVRMFAATIVDTCAALGGKPAYLLLVDANLSWTRWPELVGLIFGAGVDIREAVAMLPLSVSTVYLRPDGSVRDWRSNDGRVVYKALGLRWVHDVLG